MSGRWPKFKQKTLHREETASSPSVRRTVCMYKNKHRGKPIKVLSSSIRTYHVWVFPRNAADRCRGLRASLLKGYCFRYPLQHAGARGGRVSVTAVNGLSLGTTVAVSRVHRFGAQSIIDPRQTLTAIRSKDEDRATKIWYTHYVRQRTPFEREGKLNTISGN